MSSLISNRLFLLKRFDANNLFDNLPKRASSLYEEYPFAWLHPRHMTTSKRVQDRSRNKKIHDLEVVTEKWKIVSKVMSIMEILKDEQEMVMPVRNLEQHRSKINLPKPHKVSDFLLKSPKIFELYKDQRGVLWCGMTREGEDLLEEREKLIEENSDKAAEFVTRCLMMSVDKRIRIDKIANFRRDFGLPMDFRLKWVHKYPELFKVVKNMEQEEHLQLVSWKPEWAVTELEKKVLGASGSESDKGLSNHEPGLLSLAFPLKFPATFKKVYRIGGKIEHFQKRCYLSPYADAKGLTAGSLEFDKRAVAIMHELLSFTLEKKLVTDHLTHFRREFVMPQKLMRLLLKHFGIFYVSERGKRFSAFLTEAYEGQELIEKSPLVVWKEKLLSLIGYRGKRKKVLTFSDLSDVEHDKLAANDCDSESRSVHEENMGELEDAFLVDEDGMETGVVSCAYKDSNTS